jgi:dissimilatory sulfite reductase (desulfoviridin) alpha/beta subunit
MPGMKEFGVAAVSATAQKKELEQVLEFKVGGHALRMLPPDSSSLAVVLASDNQVEVIKGYKSWLAQHMLDDGDKVIWDLVADRSNKFGFEEVMEIVTWAIEETTAHPTQPSSGSSTSRARTGAKSTGRSPGRGSTRST